MLERPLGRFAGVFTAGLFLVAATACSGGQSPGPARVEPPVEPTSSSSQWISVDLPGQYSEMRSDLFDKTRDCVWVMSRGFASSGSEELTLTRINVADRSALVQFQIPVIDYDRGVMALDSRRVLWLGWGETLMRFDPDTGARKSWTRPPYSGLARVYSMDGRITALTIDSNDEIWVAAGMLTAVFAFDPSSETWQRPINLSFVPAAWGNALAAPAPGIITINGAALAGGAIDPRGLPRFAVITTVTRTVKTVDLPVSSYVVTGRGTIVYSDGAGSLRQLTIPELASTFLASMPASWPTIAPMAAGSDGTVWIPFTTRGFPGVSKLKPSTGAITEIPFPVVIAFLQPQPTPSPGQCVMPHSCMPIACQTPMVILCNPVFESRNPEIQEMSADSNGNIWMVTSAASATIVEDRYPMGPVVELLTS